MAIYFHNDDINYTLKHKLAIKRWIKAVVENEKKELGEINFIYCSDERLLDINKQYLEHDYYTDIITFDNSAWPIVAGDLYISIDRVVDNAGKFKVAAATELHRVMVHGVLHLLGYKDKTKKDTETMRTKEDFYLKMLKM